MSTPETWILLVEDDPEVALLLGEGLKESGFQIAMAFNVQEAMARLGKQKFHAVLLDLHLQNGNGEHVIGFLRNLRGLNHGTPILVMSGFLNAPVVKRIRRDVQEILVKPFSLTTLRARLGEMLESSKKRGQEFDEKKRDDHETAN